MCSCKLFVHDSHTFRLYLVFIIGLLLLTICFGDIDILYKKEVCDEADFYSPFVKLFKTRQPHHEHSPILKLFKSGYIDVSKHSGILCINGPAIVYTDIHQDNVCTNDTGWFPATGEPQLFSHDCFSINRLPREEYKQPGLRKLKKDSQVFGNKVFGVYLIGKSPDYRLSNFKFFPQSDFGYRPDNAWCIHNGASIVFLANSTDSSTHCYSVKKYNMEGVINVDFVEAQLFCYREDQDAEFDSPWHKSATKPLISDDITWNTCGSSSGLPPVVKDFEPEPMQLPDFRIVDPKFWSSQGSAAVLWRAKRKPGEVEDTPVYSKPNPPGSLFPGEPGWKDPSEMIHLHIPAIGKNNIVGTDVETSTMEPYQKFNVEIPEAECEEVPKPSDNCKDDNLGTNVCELLNHVLMLEETDWKSAKMADGSWRLPILNLVNSIYAKACPQVTKFLAPALSRIFQHFLSQVVEADPALETKFKEPRKREWDEMIMDLERCNEKADMMNFFRKKDLAALKLKQKLDVKLNKLQRSIASRIAASINSATVTATGILLPSTFNMNNPNHTADLMEIEKIQNNLNEFSLKFPYKILIGSSAKPGYADATRVFQYREAAEIDHELDFALDAYWKVISTVLGYCNIHYSSRDSATFMRLYESFTRDFLEYVSKLWISGENQRIYEQLFGEFIYGSGVLWIDACHDGAYQWSGTADRRPLRPIPLTQGDVLPPHVSGTSSPTNFFVDNPALSKLKETDYDEEPSSPDSLETEEAGFADSSKIPKSASGAATNIENHDSLSNDI